MSRETTADNREERDNCHKIYNQATNFRSIGEMTSAGEISQTIRLLSESSKSNLQVGPESVKKIDLFQSVIERAQTQAYDAGIGQYVHKDTIVPEDAEDKMRFKTELNYFKIMETQRKEMKKVVENYILHRDYHQEPFVPYKAEALRSPCFICGLIVPDPELLGTITFAGAMKWKEARGVPPPVFDHRMHSNDKYDLVKMCVFCTQFFDEDFSDVTATALAEKQALETVLEESPVRRKKLDKPTVRRKIVVADPTELDRPVSRIKLKLMVQKIKDQAMNDPSNRFQYNSHAPSGRIDQHKAGYLLRRKYCDDGVLESVRKERLRLERKEQEKAVAKQSVPNRLEESRTEGSWFITQGEINSSVVFPEYDLSINSTSSSISNKRLSKAERLKLQIKTLHDKKFAEDKLKYDFKKQKEMLSHVPKVKNTTLHLRKSSRSLDKLPPQTRPSCEFGPPIPRSLNKRINKKKQSKSKSGVSPPRHVKNKPVLKQKTKGITASSSSPVIIKKQKQVTSINFSDLPQKLKAMLPPVSLNSKSLTEIIGSKALKKLSVQNVPHVKPLAPLILIDPNKEKKVSKKDMLKFLEPPGSPTAPFTITITSSDCFEDDSNIQKSADHSTVYNDDDFEIASDDAFYENNNQAKASVRWSSAFFDEEDVSSVLDGIEKSSNYWNGIDSSWHGQEDVTTLPLSPRDESKNSQRIIRKSGSRPISRQLSNEYVASNPGSRVGSPLNLMRYFAPDIESKITSQSTLTGSSTKRKSTPSKRRIIRSTVKDF